MAVNGLIYMLGPKQELRGQVSTGWCHDCGEIRRFEDTDPQHLEQNLIRWKQLLESAQLSKRELRRGAFGWLNRLFDTNDWDEKIEYRAGRVNQIIALKDFLQSRPTGARCLRCDSWKYEKVSDDFRHDCGGSLIYESFQTGGRMIPAWLDVFLDAKGNYRAEQYGTDPDAIWQIK